MCTMYLPCRHRDLAVWSHLVSDSRYVCVYLPAVTGTWPYGPIWCQIAGMFVCIYPAVTGTWPYGPIWCQIAGMFVCIYPAVTGTWPYGPIWCQIAGMYVYHVSTLPSQGPGRMVPSGVR